MRDKLLLIGFCGACLAACGGGGGGGKDGGFGAGGSGGGSGGGAPSFEEMCDRGATKLCEQINACGTSYPMSTCVAAMKAQSCANGPEQFCGAGTTYQPSKASACLDALNSAGCELVDAPPAECSPEVMCSSSTSSQGGQPAGTSQGEACTALGDPGACNPNASVCYAAGKSSSCPGKVLCAGSPNSMTCATSCSTDADCSSAGTGLVCVQDCAMTILNGFCVTPKLKQKFLQSTCKSGPAAGLTGWSL